MSEMENIAPGTALIKSIRAEKAPYHSWAGEAIDNAFDALATRVELSMSKESLDCRDNGIGVTRDRSKHIVTISDHGHMSSTALGRFGIGIKYKSIQHGKVLFIQSVSEDGRLLRTVNWQEILESGKWDCPPPVWMANPVAPTGTFVSIRGLITKSPTKADIDKTREEISLRYYPALEKGWQILLNNESVLPIRRPELRDKVEAVLDFPNGKTAHIWAGMLVNPSASKLKQVDLCVAFRVIKSRCSFGCNGYSGVGSMYARIELLGDWQLTKFKDNLGEDPDEADLEARVEGILQPLLERCRGESMSMRSERLETLLNEMLPIDVQVSRPERKQILDRKGDKSGDKKPREVSNSNPSSSGPTKKNQARGIRIFFEKDLNETHGYGRTECGKKLTRIELASDNPTIAALMDHRDEKMVLEALYGFACLIYEGDIQQGRLLDEPIGLRAARLKGEVKKASEAA